MSSAGITAGIEMALRLMEKLAGEEGAQKVQLVLEYDPRPPLGPVEWVLLDRDLFEPVVDQWIREGLADEPRIVRTRQAQKVDRQAPWNGQRGGPSDMSRFWLPTMRTTTEDPA